MRQLFYTLWSLTVFQDVVATGQADEMLCDNLICCKEREPQDCGSLHASSCVLL